MARMRSIAPDPRMKLAAGVAGPVLFTASWIAATAGQHGHGDYHVAREHISGLAAPDARFPHLMSAAFLALGLTTSTFGAALRDALGGPGQCGWGPRLVQLGGIATIMAGVLRRDQMLLGIPEGLERQSWRNDGHDIASGVAYTSLVAAPVALAHRFAEDPQHRHLRGPALLTAALTSALLTLFASRKVEPYNGIVQRFGVTVPALAGAALAAWLLRQPPAPAA